MTSKLTRNFQESSSNAQRYNHITKVNLKNMKNSNTTASSLYNTERLNSINKLALINSSLITQQLAQRESLISHSIDFYKNIEIARQQAIEQRSKFLARIYHTSFQNQFETDLQKKVQLLSEQNQKRQEKFKEIFSKFNKKFEYFNVNGWLVPNQLDPAELTDINSPEDANEFMEANITKNQCLLLLTLNTCLKQEDLPNNIRELLGNVITALKNDYSSYKVMLPTIFSIIDCLINEWLSEYITTFKYVNMNAINELKEKTKNKKNENSDEPSYLYQSSVWIDILSNKYYPQKQERNNQSLTRNSVAHGSFDYTKYTIFDFAKVAFIIEHILGLKEYLEN